MLDARAYPTSPGAAAADLCAVLDAPLTVPPCRVLVPTGLAIELPGPPYCVALVYARSGLSIKHGLCMANGVGVVDSDYRGELKVPMVNLGQEAYTIQPGERGAAVHCTGVHRRLCARRRTGRYPARRGRLWLYRKVRWNHEPDLSFRQPAQAGAASLYTTNFTVCVSDFDESTVQAATPAHLVEQLARGKCLAVSAQHPGAVVIGCDTVVDVNGEVVRQAPQRRGCRADAARPFRCGPRGAYRCVHLRTGPAPKALWTAAALPFFR